MKKINKPFLLPEADDLHQKRRQKFLYSELYKNIKKELILGIDITTNEVDHNKIELMHRVDSQGFVFKEKFWLWMLEYTAGRDIDELVLLIPDIVSEFEKWEEENIPYRLYLKEKFLEHNKIYGGKTELEISAVDFDNQLEYQTLLQFISVLILLRDAQSVKRVIKAMRYNRYADGLYEQLIADYVPDPQTEMEEVIFEEPYGLLLDAYFEEKDEESIEWVQDYLKSWYKAQDGARWFDSHRKIVEDQSFYYGYWAFEAGATCYLLQLDDSQIDHMVYPKDLVAYARKLQAEKRWNSPMDGPVQVQATGPETPDRIAGGEPCPTAGWWHTPAQAGSRSYFKAGDVMPVIENSAYGETFWIWDANQEAPKL